MATTKIPFNSQYGSRNRSRSCFGTRVTPEYGLRIDSHGVEYLKQTGQTNTYEFIQSFRDSVDIDILLQRFKDGDLDALNRVHGFFADISEMPTDFVGIVNVNARGAELFESLDPDIKAKFGNSYIEFLSSDLDYIDSVFHPDFVENSVDNSDIIDGGDIANE